MVAISVALAQNVEVESVDLVPNVLMIQEKFRQVAQVLRVHLLLLGIKFEHRNLLVAVDLITGWTSHLTALRVSLELTLF